MKTWKLCAGVAAVIAAAASVHAATISYTGGTYDQDFDALPKTGTFALTGHGPFDVTAAPINSGASMSGWYLWQAGGTGANTDFHVVDGSESGAAGRGGGSYGTVGSSDRAFGGLSTSADIPSVGALFTNNSGGTLTDITISFTGEQWRRGDATTHDLLTFAYAFQSSLASPPAFTSEANLNFASPNTLATPNNVALNGNDLFNQAAVSFTISGLNWLSGTDLAIRWTAQDNSGQDDALAIDNFHLSATSGGVTPEPGTAMVGVLGALSLAARRRRSK